MRALEQNIVVEQDGVVEIGELPVPAGDRVRVIVLISDEQQPNSQPRYPLRGQQPYRFDDPISPVALEDLELE